MANTKEGRVWQLTEPDIISRTPIFVNKIIYYATTVDHACIFSWYDKTNPIAAGCGQGTATITSDTTITFTSSVVPSDIVVGSVFDIVGSTGASANIGPELVTTAGTNTVVVCSQADWTNEATIKYSFKTYPAHQGPYMKIGHTDAILGSILTFEQKFGMWFPNLILSSISSGEVHVYLS